MKLARSPVNKSPETNSFVLSGSPEEKEEIMELLKDGVGHLAFESGPRTKPTSSLELRDEEYRLHGIYSGFFEISHRKKRRIIFAAKDLLEAVKGAPSVALANLMNGADTSDDLPEQLAFFLSILRW